MTASPAHAGAFHALCKNGEGHINAMPNGKWMTSGW
jgi:hypothetical protein